MSKFNQELKIIKKSQSNWIEVAVAVRCSSFWRQIIEKRVDNEELKDPGKKNKLENSKVTKKFYGAIIIRDTQLSVFW